MDSCLQMTLTSYSLTSHKEMMQMYLYLYLHLYLCLYLCFGADDGAWSNGPFSVTFWYCKLAPTTAFKIKRKSTKPDLISLYDIGDNLDIWNIYNYILSALDGGDFATLGSGLENLIPRNGIPDHDERMIQLLQMSC